jgi:hypothetical protein
MPRVECTRIGVSCEGNPVHIEGEQVVGVSKSLVASPSGFRSTIQLASLTRDLTLLGVLCFCVREIIFR